MTEPTAPVAAPDLLATLEAARGDAAVLAETLYRHVCRAEAAELASSHAPESDGRGHALLASAVAYCVGYELRATGAPVDPTLLRVAALAHDLALPAEALALLPAPVPRWLANRDLFFDALPGSPFPLHHWTAQAERALYAAHLVAALPLPVAPNRPATQAFREHPLGRGEPLASVALVYGGATRIKGYVFESPRLPEIRGASGLLDRINRVDLPALFGARFDAPADAAAAARIRDWFAARGGAAPLEAPECVLYAGGGNLLALAPASLAAALQAAIEAWYATETLVAQSVAASRACELLELQYGRQPTRYWWQEYAAVQADDALRALLSYPATPASPSPVEPPPGKGFGELTTELVLLSARRRDERATYPNWETPPYTRRCGSCDRRAASVAVPRAGAALCLPCWRKREVGEQLKHGSEAGFRAWIDRFVEYLEGDGTDTPYARAVPPGGWAIVESPADLDDLGAASHPAGYVGVIYADGDAMGDQVERQSTPAAFRAFSERLAEATEQAVYAALAHHLRPVQGRDGRWQHPFEVLNIGGDDVLLLVPGSVALATAAAIGRQFEARFPAAAGAAGDGWADQRYHPPDDPRARVIQPPRPVGQSLSAGIVVAPMATPMALLRELAEQLQQSAKQARRAVDGGLPRGWGDFLVIKGAGLLATSLDGWRRQTLGADSGEAGRQPRGQRGRGRRPPRLSATPYTWPELEGLLATARALGASGYPRAQLHAVRELLVQGEAAASVDYLYYRTRLEPHHRRQVVAHLEQAWSGPEGATQVAVAPPWRQRRPRNGQDPRDLQVETILPDLLAVYDFCAARLGGDDDSARGDDDAAH
jgi:CRISPR-associated protein Cmr2